MAYYATNNGLTVIACDANHSVQSGEVFFADFPTSEQLAEAFTGYAAAQSIATALPVAQALLAKTDMVVKRINEGISLGLTTATTADVVTYITFIRALRAWVSNPTGAAPTEPSYPSGT